MSRSKAAMWTAPSLFLQRHQGDTRPVLEPLSGRTASSSSSSSSSPSSSLSSSGGTPSLASATRTTDPGWQEGSSKVFTQLSQGARTKRVALPTKRQKRIRTTQSGHTEGVTTDETPTSKRVKPCGEAQWSASQAQVWCHSDYTRAAWDEQGAPDAAWAAFAILDNAFAKRFSQHQQHAGEAEGEGVHQAPKVRSACDDTTDTTAAEEGGAIPAGEEKTAHRSQTEEETGGKGEGPAGGEDFPLTQLSQFSQEQGEGAKVEESVSAQLRAEVEAFYQLLLSSPQEQDGEKELLLKDGAQRLRACSLGVLPQVCDGLRVPTLPDQELLLLCRVFVTQDMSFSTCRIFLQKCLVPVLVGLKRPATRVLFQALVWVAQSHATAVVKALLGPVLQDPGMGTWQCEVVNRVVKELSPQLRTECLDLLLHPQMTWTNGHIKVAQNLLHGKVQLTEALTAKLVGTIDTALAVSSSPLRKSLLFSTLLLTLASKYSADVKPFRPVLLRTSELLETFLKKPIVKALTKG